LRQTFGEYLNTEHLNTEYLNTEYLNTEYLNTACELPNSRNPLPRSRRLKPSADGFAGVGRRR